MVAVPVGAPQQLLQLSHFDDMIMGQVMMTWAWAK